MSTQNRAPSFPFYAKDWLSDAKVRSLSNANRGKYIDLLASMWEYGDAGCYIPRATAERLYGKAFVRTIADLPTSPLACEDMHGEPYLFSDRLLREAQKYRSRSEAARRSAEIRWERERERSK